MSSPARTGSQSAPATPRKTQDSSADDLLELKSHSFFHAANSPDDAQQIRRSGFRSEWIDEDGRWQRDGNLGIGIYVTRRWQTAVMFGTVLLRVSLRRGTRILDASLPPDPAVLQYLKKEFGRSIVSGDPRKFLPRNKKLTQRELIALTRRHYTQLWEKNWGRDKDGFQRWPAKRQQHAQALAACVSLLKRCGFHGYGNPADDNGIVIFSADRVVLNEVLAEIPPQEHWRLLESEPVSFDKTTLADLQRRCPAKLRRHGEMS